MKQCGISLEVFQPSCRYPREDWWSRSGVRHRARDLQTWGEWYLRRGRWVFGLSPSAILCLMPFFQKPVSLPRNSHFQSQCVPFEVVVVSTGHLWIWLVPALWLVVSGRVVISTGNVLREGLPWHLGL